MSVVTDQDGRILGGALRGSAGGRTVQELIERLGPVTGTLASGGPGGWSLTVLAGGTPVRTVEVGDAPDPGAVDLPFVLHEHPVDDAAPLPTLPSLLPETTWPGLLAVPHGPGVREIPCGLAPLPSLTAHLDASGARGVLAVHGGAGSAAAVVAGGRIVAAVGDKHGREVQRGDAMRLLARHATDPAAPPMLLVPLPDAILSAVAGVLLDRRRDAPHGVRVGERAAVLTDGGEDRLRIVYPAAERLGRFAAEIGLDRLPALPLPDDPPDWETRTYHLTLRGRDALDPMSEVSMRFASEYGPTGKRILQALRRGLDVETTGAEVGVELDELGGWLRRLEGEGFVRVGS